MPTSSSSSSITNKASKRKAVGPANRPDPRKKPSTSDPGSNITGENGASASGSGSSVAASTASSFTTTGFMAGAKLLAPILTSHAFLRLQKGNLSLYLALGDKDGAVEFRSLNDVGNEELTTIYTLGQEYLTCPLADYLVRSFVEFGVDPDTQMVQSLVGPGMTEKMDNGQFSDFSITNPDMFLLYYGPKPSSPSEFGELKATAQFAVPLCKDKLTLTLNGQKAPQDTGTPNTQPPKPAAGASAKARAIALDGSDSDEDVAEQVPSVPIKKKGARRKFRYGIPLKSPGVLDVPAANPPPPLPHAPGGPARHAA